MTIPPQLPSNPRLASVLALALALVGVVWVQSHPGPHPPPPPPPPPVKPPPLSPGFFLRGDPHPNAWDTDTGLSTGGIRYSWRIEAVGTLSAPLEGVVGALSWSDPESATPNTGWTRSAGWVALRLRSPSRVTIRLAPKAGVVDIFGQLPDETAGPDLRPAFTLYSGWQATGADETTYPNRGPIPWAPSLTYISHSASADGPVEASFELPAGLYTIALGGNGASGFDPGRQGYGATVSILSRARPALVAPRGARFTTRRASHTLRGRFLNPQSAALLAVQQGKRTRFIRANGPSWSVVVRGLRPGINHVFLTAISHDGRTSTRRRIVIIRP
jgi:hypothetical protein